MAVIGVDQIYNVRWSFFAATVVLAGMVVFAIMLLVTRTIQRSNVVRPPRIVGTVIIGFGSLLADALTFIAAVSGGWMLGYIFAVDMVLLGVFLWRIVQHRLGSRRSPPRPTLLP